MKNLLLCMALVLLMGQMAFATPELFLKTGATTATVGGVGSNVSLVLTTLGGWSISAVIGASHSPSTSPNGIDIASLTATCSGGVCVTNPLDVWLSDIGFTATSTNFTNNYSATITGGTGTTSESAWVGLGNVLFQSSGADGGPTVAGGTSIGTVTLTGTGVLSNAVTGGPSAGPAPYSLTIEDVFNGTGTTTVQYSTDGAISTVPEPASVVLLGGLVLFVSSRLRRRKV